MRNAWRRVSRPRRTIRDFHRTRYGNPLFAKPGQTRRGRRMAGPRPWMLMAAAGAALLGAAWYLLWGPTFRITKIEVNGVSGSTEEAIRAALAERLSGRMMLILPKDNILVFDRGRASSDIAGKVYLDGITLRKKLPGTIEIEAKEKTMRAALDQADRLFAIDEAGFALRELSNKEIALLGDLPPGMDTVPVRGLGAETVNLAARAGAQTPPAPAKTDMPAKTPAPTRIPPPQKGSPLPLIVGPKGGAAKSGVVAPGTAMFTAMTMRTILQANSRLSDVAGVPIRWFQVQESSETVEADMAGGWRILMSTAIPFDVQAERLGIVLNEKIGAKKTSLEYVDLRYNERIFFRMKEGSPAQ